MKISLAVVGVLADAIMKNNGVKLTKEGFCRIRVVGAEVTRLVMRRCIQPKYRMATMNHWCRVNLDMEEPICG